MLKNYLRVALRSMLRQRIYASINIVGLTIGIVSAILITTFVRYELDFDSDIPGISRVYRVVQRQPGNIYLGSDQFVVTPAPLARTLEAEIPEIETATTLVGRSGLLSHKEDHYYETGLLADDHFFGVLGYSLEQGAADNCNVTYIKRKCTALFRHATP